MAIRDPDWFPCGHPRTPQNKTAKGDCAECNRRRAAKAAQIKRQAKIAKYGPGRKPRDDFDPERYPCGHPRTPQNTKGGKSACLTCHRLREFARHAAGLAAAGKQKKVYDPDRFPCDHPRTEDNLNARRCCLTCQRRRMADDKRANPLKYKVRSREQRYRRRAKRAEYHRARRRKSPYDPVRGKFWTERRSDPETREYVAILLCDLCVYCGGSAGTVDHIAPISTGGANNWNNFAAACQRCNSSKGAKSLLGFLLDRRLIADALAA